MQRNWLYGFIMALVATVLSGGMGAEQALATPFSFNQGSWADFSSRQNGGAWASGNFAVGTGSVSGSPFLVYEKDSLIPSLHFDVNAYVGIREISPTDHAFSEPVNLGWNYNQSHINFLEDEYGQVYAVTFTNPINVDIDLFVNTYDTSFGGGKGARAGSGPNLWTGLELGVDIDSKGKIGYIIDVLPELEETNVSINGSNLFEDYLWRVRTEIGVDPGFYSITAVVPEPATCGLLAMGALVGGGKILRQRRERNMIASPGGPRRRR